MKPLKFESTSVTVESLTIFYGGDGDGVQFNDGGGGGGGAKCGYMGGWQKDEFC